MVRCLPFSTLLSSQPQAHPAGHVVLLQGWQQVLGSPQFGGAVADLPRCVALPVMHSSTRPPAIAAPHNAAGSLAVTPREYALVTLSEKAEGSGYRPPGLHASQPGVSGARASDGRDGKAGYGPVWRGAAPAEGGPNSLSSATPWHYTFAPTSRWAAGCMSGPSVYAASSSGLF